MLNACHFGPRCHELRSEPFMNSSLYACFRSDLASYSHLLCVMIRQPPGVTTTGPTPDDDRSLRSSCIHYVLMLCSGSLLKGGLNKYPFVSNMDPAATGG